MAAMQKKYKKGVIFMENATKAIWAYLDNYGYIKATDEKYKNKSSTGEIDKKEIYVPFTGLMHCGHPIVNGEEVTVMICPDGEVKASKEITDALQEVISALKEANGIK